MWRLKMSKKVYRNEFFIAMFAVLIVINVLPFAFAEWMYGEAFRDHFFLSLMNRFPIAGFSSFLFLILYRVKQRKEFLWLTISTVLLHLPDVVFISMGGSAFSIIAERRWNMSICDVVNINSLVGHCNHLLRIIAGFIFLVAILEFAGLRCKTRKRPLIAVFLILLSSSLPWWNLIVSQDGGSTTSLSPWWGWGLLRVEWRDEVPIEMESPLMINFTSLFLATLFLNAAIFLMFLASIVRISTVKRQYLLICGGISTILAPIFFACSLEKVSFFKQNPFFGSVEGTTWFLSIGFFLSILIGLTIIIRVLHTYMRTKDIRIDYEEKQS